MALTPKIKELTPSQSISLIKGIFKDKDLKISKSKMIPGDFCTYNYDAKDKTQTYDRTPLVVVLKRNKTHTMCINLHWAPLPLRVILVKKIIAMNKKNIQNNKPLQFSYIDIKPFLKKVGFAPIIRLYINSRISSSVVKIPSDQLMNIARTKTETFTKGKVSAEQLYKRALSKNKQYRTGRKRRE